MNRQEIREARTVRREIIFPELAPCYEHDINGKINDGYNQHLFPVVCQGDFQGVSYKKFVESPYSRAGEMTFIGH